MSLQDNHQPLVNDMQSVISDAESLLKNVSSPQSEAFQSARMRLENTLKRAKDEAIRIEKMVVGKTREAAQVTDHYVKSNPWQAVGLSAAVGLVVGLLIARK